MSDNEYIAVLQAQRAASARFYIAQKAYRARTIGDAEFLAARAEYDASEVAFSKARGEYPESAA